MLHFDYEHMYTNTRTCTPHWGTIMKKLLYSLCLCEVTFIKPVWIQVRATCILGPCDPYFGSKHGNRNLHYHSTAVATEHSMQPLLFPGKLVFHTKCIVLAELSWENMLANTLHVCYIHVCTLCEPGLHGKQTFIYTFELHLWTVAELHIYIYIYIYSLAELNI